MAASSLVWLAVLSIAQLPADSKRVGLGEGDVPEPRIPTVIFETKWTEPAVEIFLEHTGPYWTTGPLLTKVREFMVDHNQTGQMFVRYLTHPLWNRSRRVRAQIGFVADRSIDVEPPFKMIRRDPEFVACTLIEDRTVNPRTDYGPILAWCEDRGHRTGGPIVELYGPADTKRWATEIRVVLDPPTRPPAIAPGPPASAEVTAGKGLKGREPERPHTPEVSVAPNAPVSPERTGVATIPPGPPKPTERKDQPACERERTLTEFVAAERFDCIAFALMPAWSTVPVEHQAWIGHVVFRVKAIAEGIKPVEPGGAAMPLAMSNALMRRYRKVAAGFALDPFNQRDVITHPAQDSFAKEKRAIVLSLDVLMVRISVDSIDEAATRVELIRILQEAANLVRRSTTEQDQKIDASAEDQP